MTELPTGWRSVALDEIADIRPGRTPNKLDRYLTDNPRTDRTVPFFKVGDMNDHPSDLRNARTYLAQEELVRLGVSVLPVDSIVFPKAGGAIATNKKRRIAVPGVVDLNCMAVVPRGSVDARYLREWFESFDLTSIADGSVLPQISKKRVAALRIPLPELRQQRRVVDLLEDHLSRLDSAQVSLGRAARATGVMNLSVLSEIRRLLLGSSVRLVRLGEVCETSLGKMLDAKKASGSPTPYLRNINVRWGAFDLSDVKTVPLNEAEQAKLEVKPGDLLVCEGGEPGRCAVWVDGPSGITYQKALHRVRAKDPNGVVPDFVALLLQEFIRRGRADRMFTGTTIRHLPQEKLRIIELPIPELPAQRATVARVAAHMQGAERLSSELNRVATEGKALRRSLLRAAFTGRLTGGATDMEMVEEMAGV
jgi:restriction endonuclease S subunit